MLKVDNFHLGYYVLVGSMQLSICMMYLTYFTRVLGVLTRKTNKQTNKKQKQKQKQKQQQKTKQNKTKQTKTKQNKTKKKPKQKRKRNKSCGCVIIFLCTPIPYLLEIEDLTANYYLCSKSLQINYCIVL